MNKKGLTLVEAVVSLLIAGVAVMGALAAITGSFGAKGVSDNRVEASMILETAADKLRLYTYANITHIPAELRSGLCGGDTNPISTGTHTITCLLTGTPLQGGTLTYTVTPYTVNGLTYRKIVFTLTTN